MPLRFTFRQLEYVVAVSDAGSIAHAADLVNVSSPSISAAISQLEAELGLQLFVRQRAQGLKVTPAGQRIVAEARRILAAAEALSGLAHDIGTVPRGPVALGCLVTLAPFVGPAFSQSFSRAYSEAHVTAVAADQAGLIERLRRAEIDLALTYDLEIPSDVDFAGHIRLPPFVMVGAGHPLAGQERVALADLVAAPMVLLDLPISRDYFLSLFHAQGLRPRIDARTPDLSILRSMVANGTGFSLMNFRTRLRQAPDGAPLHFLRLEGDHRPISMGLARLRSPHRPKVVTAFAAHVAERLAAGDIPGLDQG